MSKCVCMCLSVCLFVCVCTRVFVSVCVCVCVSNKLILNSGAVSFIKSNLEIITVGFIRESNHTIVVVTLRLENKALTDFCSGWAGVWHMDRAYGLVPLEKIHLSVLIIL